MNAHPQTLSRVDNSTETTTFHRNRLYTLGGVAALTAMIINISDVILGFGSSEFITYGSKSAVDWFTLFEGSTFDGLYALGIFNIAYMLAMLPVYFALLWAHRRRQGLQAVMVLVLFVVATAIYLSTNAAIPMLVLSGKYALAQTETQKQIFSAAGEAILARGEDFTPGSFIGLILSSIAAVLISIIMLRGGIFDKRHAWIGIAGFTCLSLFTILATFVPVLYTVTFYVFGSLGGMFALTWFALTSRRLFQLGRSEE